jgi:hypothetical protein
MELAPAPARLAAMLLVQSIGGPEHFSPVLSITTWTGPLTFFRAVATPRSTLRQENVVWSGTGRFRPSRSMIEPSRPSVWRQGRPNASLSINPASIATSEYLLGCPRRPVAAGIQAAIASGVTQTVRLPRLSRKQRLR